MGVTADDAMDRLFDLAVVLGDLMNRRLAEHGLTPARAEMRCTIFSAKCDPTADMLLACLRTSAMA